MTEIGMEVFFFYLTVDCLDPESHVLVQSQSYFPQYCK